MVSRVLNRESAATTPGQVILWWEARRVPYNMVVGLVGFLSVAVLLALGPRVAQPDEPLFSPFFLFGGILVYGVAANTCYTAGWIIELAIRKLGAESTDKFAQNAFKSGLLFSCLLTSLPIWFVLILWLSHLR
jgi:hypothetical protein